MAEPLDRDMSHECSPVAAEIPPRVEYELTALGRILLGPMNAVGTP